MLNELLKDEELGRILFAEILNSNGCDTGVDTEELFKKYLEDNNMEDIPTNIRELEEMGKNNEPMVTLKELEEREKFNAPEYEERLSEQDYYAGNGLSPLEAFKKGLLSHEELIGFIKGNVIKYTVRAGHKENASKDIVKAIDYLTHLKEIYETEMRYNKVEEEVIRAFEGLKNIEEVDVR